MDRIADEEFDDPQMLEDHKPNSYLYDKLDAYYEQEGNFI